MRCSLLLICASVLLATEPVSLRLEFERDLRLHETSGPLDGLSEVVMQGRAKRYDPELRQLGLHITGGSSLHWAGSIRAADWNSAQIVGVHGAGSELRFGGRWQGDAGGGFPMLWLTEGGRLVFTAAAQVDFVLEKTLYTRQLWAGGDGSGELELEPGFIADRSQNGTLPEACGTIRLNGVTLITHHSQSLPFNTRPDGRGGSYPNGHICIDGPATWSVRSAAQTYPASVDFAADGRIDTQADLIHIGRRRTALDVGGSGHFVSPGVFQTTKPGVTVTKTGAAMLALDGESGWMPDSTLVIAEGLLRVHNDPGEARFNHQHGQHLALVVTDRALLAAPLMRLRRLDLQAGATVWLDRGATLAVTEPLQIVAGATLIAAGRIEGDLRSEGTLRPSPWGDALTIVGAVDCSGAVELPVAAEPWLRVEGTMRLGGTISLRPPARGFVIPETGVVLLRATQLELADGLADSEVRLGERSGRLHAAGDGSLHWRP